MSAKRAGASSESQAASSGACASKAIASSASRARSSAGGDKLLNEQQESQRRRFQFLLSHLNAEQLERYEQFRRGAFPKSSIRRVISSVCKATVSQNCVIGMCSTAKIFITDVIEAAYTVRVEQREEAQPLKPKHIREALRRIREHTPANRKRLANGTLFNN